MNIVVQYFLRYKLETIRFGGKVNPERKRKPTAEYIED
jgi:hypothetical protein